MSNLKDNFEASKSLRNRRTQETAAAGPRVPDETWVALAQAFSARVNAYVPDWTGPTTHDPGITLLELFTFLTSELMKRDLSTSTDPRSTAADTWWRTMKPDLTHSTCIPLRRVRYFAGQVLGVDDFQTEQDYFRTKLRRHNLLLHGSGIVSGLDVEVQTDETAGGQATITVNPGVAIDAEGNEIVLCERSGASAPLNFSECFVMIGQSDVPVDAAATTLTDESSNSEASRFEEHVQIQVGATVLAGAVALARLVKDETGWHVDPNFRPNRTR